ncbi:MAG: hypothetical protein HeimC3_34210 [Candidatus Heimdallarchaeota archaeon LC_3]|nr:MAG: hypothetical protein HeimC3_34210 [Candidatus Heimdallarchaeota archaeon LC_3]
MSFNFFQINQKDSFGTIIISISIVSRIIEVGNSEDLIRFTLLSSIFALFLQFMFNLIKIVFFRYWDITGGYEGRGRYEFAWDHIDYRSYKLSLLFNFRVLTAVFIFLLPNNLFFFSLDILNSPFIFENLYSSLVMRDFFFLSFFIILLVALYHGSSSFEKLRTVRIFNALNNWNEEMRMLIREESWDELFYKLDKIDKKTVSEINKIQEWVDKFKLINDPPFNEFLLFVLFNNSEFDWRTKFNVDLKESPLFSSSNNDIFPFYQRSLSNRYYHLNNGLIKTIYAFKYLLNQPIIDFFKDSYERIEDDVILLDLVIVLCNIPKNVFYAYLPNEDIVYSPENLEPIKNVVIDNLKIEYRKSNLFKKYPNKFISHIIHHKVNLGKLFLLTINNDSHKFFPKNEKEIKIKLDKLFPDVTNNKILKYSLSDGEKEVKIDVLKNENYLKMILDSILREYIHLNLQHNLIIELYKNYHSEFEKFMNLTLNEYDRLLKDSFTKLLITSPFNRKNRKFFEHDYRIPNKLKKRIDKGFKKTKK